MSEFKKLKEVAYSWSVGRDGDGDFVLFNHLDEDSTPFYLSIGTINTLDYTLAELRAACQDPRERVIAAARAYIAGDCEDASDLTEAVEALENEDEDAEE